jgi:hypothetical protein
MIDRWYYTHGGQTLGPVTAVQLRHLASSGQLAANDLIWPEGRQQSEAVPAQAAIIFQAPAVTLANKPAWLDDIRAAAEQEQALLSTFEWDGDNAAVEEEEAKQILDELETTPQPQPTTKAVPTTAAVGACRLVIGSATTRGRVRDRNEDSLLVQQCAWSNLDQRRDVALIVVADGMGGHQAGERASGLVVRSLGNVWAPLLSAVLNEQPQQPSPGDLLEGGLREANRLVREAAQRSPAWKGMGSTAVVLFIWEGKSHIRLVGDCRVYHWRGGKLTQVTRDQTLVEL